jgi:hypothetical protein
MPSHRTWIALALLAAAGAAALYAARPLDGELRALRQKVGPGRDLAGFVESDLAAFLTGRPDASVIGIRVVALPSCSPPASLAAWWQEDVAALHIRVRARRFALAFEARDADCRGADCWRALHSEADLTGEALTTALRELGCAASAGMELSVGSDRATFSVRFDEWGCVEAVSGLVRPGREPSWSDGGGRSARCALYPKRYRLSGSGGHWDAVGDDPVVTDLRRRYPEYFEIVLDPGAPEEANLRTLRDDLERAAVDRRNFDALNSIAIGYFELNYRAQADLGGSHYLANSFRAAKLIAVPWRAYGEIEDGPLRDAILDFFEDAATGDKLAAQQTAGRLERVIAALEPKEDDAARRQRIQRLLRRLRRGD